MVFSFMLLMTVDEKRQTMPGQTAPERRESSGHSSLVVVPEEKIGHLTKKDGELYLKFDSTLYHPRWDVTRLEKEQRVSVTFDKEGGKKRVLYLGEDRANQVLLAEYLNAFQYLSRQGIGVAFAERVK